MFPGQEEERTNRPLFDYREDAWVPRSAPGLAPAPAGAYTVTSAFHRCILEK